MGMLFPLSHEQSLTQQLQSLMGGITWLQRLCLSQSLLTRALQLVTA